MSLWSTQGWEQRPQDTPREQAGAKTSSLSFALHEPSYGKALGAGHWPRISSPCSHQLPGWRRGADGQGGSLGARRPRALKRRHGARAGWLAHLGGLLPTLLGAPRQDQRPPDPREMPPRDSGGGCEAGQASTAPSRNPGAAPPVSHCAPETQSTPPTETHTPAPTERYPDSPSSQEAPMRPGGHKQ